MFSTRTLSALLFVCMAGCTLAFSPAHFVGAPSLRQAKASTLQCNMSPMNKAATGAAVAALLLVGSPVLNIDQAFAATAPNPYAKEAPAEAAAPKAANRAEGPSPVIIIGGVLVGSLALSYPFFKRSVERMGEKASGKRD